MSMQMGSQDLGRLIHSYPGGRVRQQVGVRNCTDRTAHRKRSPDRSREGAKPYIGNADLNDDVRSSRLPFLGADLWNHNRKSKLDIVWRKDHDRDVESAPWFKVFKGDRIIDHHLTLAGKRAAPACMRRT